MVFRLRFSFRFDIRVRLPLELLRVLAGLLGHVLTAAALLERLVS